MKSVRSGNVSLEALERVGSHSFCGRPGMEPGREATTFRASLIRGASGGIVAQAKRRTPGFYYKEQRR
jgi:hypothetical protein